jgi:hypothetical protein
MAAAKASIAGATRAYVAWSSYANKAIRQQRRAVSSSSFAQISSAGDEAGIPRDVAIAKACIMTGNASCTVADLIHSWGHTNIDQPRMNAKLVSLELRLKIRD